MKKPSHNFDQFMKTRAGVALAYVEGDATPLDAILATRAPSTFFGPGGGHVRGAAEVRESDHAGAAHFAPGGDSHLEVLHAQACGDLAYWVGIQHAHVMMKGKPAPVAMDLRVTEIFMHEEGGWKLIHRHADMLAEPQARPGK